MSGSESSSGAEAGQRTLLANLAAVRSVVGAVEGTLGPRGLDCLLIDGDGQIILTNDGVTVLQHLEAAHPAARLLIQAAKAQERAVGDGTTTATVLAGAMIGEGAAQILRGVPATRVVDGLKRGLELALAELAALRRPVSGLDDPVLYQTALIAARGDAELSAAIRAGARLLGPDGIKRLSLLGLEGAVDEARDGVLIERAPAAPEMPLRIEEARVLVLDGAVEAEQLPAEALSSAAGLALAEDRRERFRAELEGMARAGVNLILAGRGICDEAVEFFVDRGILAVRRVAEEDLRRAASFVGARLMRRMTIQGFTPPEALGRAALVEVDPEAGAVRLTGGAGQAEAFVVVGGRTGEVVAERERIARDAIASMRYALEGGVVPGGGAVELALSRALARVEATGLARYGIACVGEALKQIPAQLAINAGFNPLEKVEEAYAAQERAGTPNLGLDAETGAVIDLAAAGVWDPHPVKEHALRTAGEVAAAVLRINNILKMRPGADDESGWYDPA